MIFIVEYVLIHESTGELVDHAKRKIKTDHWTKWWEILDSQLGKEFDMINLELNVIEVKVVNEK